MPDTMITIIDHEEAFEKIVNLIKDRVGQTILLISELDTRRAFKARIVKSCSPLIFHEQDANASTHVMTLHRLSKTPRRGGVYWAETPVAREATGLFRQMTTAYRELQLVKIVCATVSIGEDLAGFGDLSAPDIIVVRL